MNMDKTTRIARTDLLLGVVFVVFLAFAWRLIDIQVVRHDEYMAKANALQISSRVLRAQRGRIYARDADGSVVPLVLNETVYDVAVDPYMFWNEAGEFDFHSFGILHEVMNEALGRKVLDGVWGRFYEGSRYVLIARQVSRVEALKIQELVKNREVDGVSLSPGSRRVYIEDGLAAQVLGFVNLDGEGQYGIEQYLDGELRGRDGLLESVRDARNTPLPIGIHEIDIPAEDGDDIVLTIDRNIQVKAEEALAMGLSKVGATRGSVVVIDPNSGEMMAMANFPSYNPAEYGNVTDPALFLNATTNYAYEPGSVAKVLTMGVGLDTGAVSRNSTYANRDCIEVDDAKICNVLTGLNKTLTMTDILSNSLNTGVNFVLEQLGGGENNLQARQTLYDYFTGNYRFGKLTGIEQPGENLGVLSLPDTVHGARVVYANMVFGQGMNVTMAQFTSAFMAAVNGGNFWRPHLVAGVLEDGVLQPREAELVQEGVLKTEVSQELKEMLLKARRVATSGIYDGGYNVGGKSGTAQIYDAATGKYSDDLYVGSYAGFGADREGSLKYVIMVRVDDSRIGGFAGTDAAMPIFNEISNYMINYMGVSK